MLKEIHFKSASSVGELSLSLPLRPSVTIFVGPNNSGKSLLLREIRDFCHSGNRGDHNLILDRIEFDEGDRSIAEAELHSIRRALKPGEYVDPRVTPVILNGNAMEFDTAGYLSAFVAPNQHTHTYCRYRIAHSTLSLDGPSRTQLINAQRCENLLKPNQPLARMFGDIKKKKKWRSDVYDAFGIYPGIDVVSSFGSLGIRFSEKEPTAEESLGPDSLAWVSSARTIDLVSDGVKAFTGILLQLYSGDPRIVILDEPEAFLHPALARRLGTKLASAARDENKFVFVATHSADFVMGAIQSGAVVNIIRVTHTNGTSTARLLPSEELSVLMNDPMLRSVGVLSGLFFENVVVAEGDTDRAFYQEINERLLSAEDTRAIRHALFLNAGGKDSVPSIVDPLRQLGIPAAAVVDIDVLYEGGQKWFQHIETCGLPESQRDALQLQRKSTYDALIDASEGEDDKAKRKYAKTNGGIQLLGDECEEAAANLFDELDRYGLFVVRRGEVEAWMSHLGLPQKEGRWRSAVFEKMGSDPKKSNYVRPASGDVWDFIGTISAWLGKSDRRGIPK